MMKEEMREATERIQTKYALRLRTQLAAASPAT